MALPLAAIAALAGIAGTGAQLLKKDPVTASISRSSIQTAPVAQAQQAQLQTAPQLQSLAQGALPQVAPAQQQDLLSLLKALSAGGQ
jgi:hypothetical protein